MIGFSILTVLLVIGSIQVIRCRDLVHGVLWLALTLMVTAAAYAYLDAGFVAAIQVLLYTGGVVILMLFAVMLTKRLEGASIAIDSTGWFRAVIVALVMFGVFASSILSSALPAKGESSGELAQVGALFLTRHLAAFEALSILLLAAMVGAIVLARRKDA